MVKLYVEGGGDAASLKTACRQGFATFFDNAGIKNRPRVIACGSRGDAFDSFCTAVKNNEDALLLVDSEEAIAAKLSRGKPKDWKPWEHLKSRKGDNWDMPPGALGDHCHLMVECMESWFIADPDTLQKFFGQGFKANKLPSIAARSIEDLSKKQIYDALGAATKNCKTKEAYGKGEHSFKILALIDPAKVKASSKWANRLIEKFQ